MTKVRNGPKCASTGLGGDAFAGVRHSPAFSRRAQRRITGALSAASLPKMTNSRYPPGRGGPDRLQRGQGVHGALVLAGHAPPLVITHAVAAVEVADAVRAMVSRAEVAYAAW
jgi:hypothetical protein